MSNATKLYHFSKPDSVRFSGAFDHALRSLSSGLFCRINFSKTADYFRDTLDPFAAGEFWGKLMRAACVIAEYTGDAALRKVVDDAMEDMLSIQAPDGNISTTPREKQPNGTHGSDLWERKYVLLGMLAYYHLSGSQRVLDAACRLADYTAAQVGNPPKTPITQTGWAFCGIESSSILDPIMQLYNLTGRDNYLALGRHIIEESGACARENIFTAIENGKSPWEIGSNGNPHESIAKAYEMMSCFEGLLEYYLATGNARWLRIATLFADRVNKEEITHLGSGGADAPFNLGPGVGEQWNRTASEQTNPAIHKTMETCVTITYMKLMARLYLINGDVSLIDRIEVSLYNALLGAMKEDGSYFDYFPKFNGLRSTEVNFAYQVGDISLSCCTANGPAGIALLPQLYAVCRSDGAIAFNLYADAEIRLRGYTFRMTSEYPYGSRTTLTFLTVPESAETQTLLFRIPGWCDNAAMQVCGKPAAVQSAGYTSVTGSWKAGDTIELSFPIQPVVHAAPHGSDRAGDPFVLVTAGPLVLSRDRRFDPQPDAPVSPSDNTFTRLPAMDGTRCLWRMSCPGYADALLCDYASAGTTWDEGSRYRSWLPVSAEK